MSFPDLRMLRSRQSPSIRRLLQETRLHKSDFIYPIFVSERLKEKKAIKKMPGIFQHSPSTLLQEVERVVQLGIEYDHFIRNSK